VKRRLLRRVAGLAAVALLLYATALAALWWGQERLLFRPRPLPEWHRFERGAGVHEAWVEVPGARLHALHLRLPQPHGVVFFLHANAGNLQSWFVDVDLYRRLDLDLYMLDYRGFGKSSGRIGSQAELEADVRAAWHSIAALYTGKRRIFLGHSLGSGLAAGLAAEVQPEFTVLLSPYSSMADLAREHFPWVPRSLLRYPLRSDLALARVQTPVLLIHGERDSRIPPVHSHRLQAVQPAAELLLVPGAGHGDIHRHPVYREALAAALGRR